MLQQAISISLLAAMAAIPPAASQGIRGTISGNQPMAAPATRVLVATPYPSSSADSATAVLMGNAFRNKLSSNIGGSDWLIIPRRDMNEYLVKWGYSPDQLFAPETARQMVTPMSARVFVMTTVVKGADGRYTASARMSGASDEAGQVVRSTQAAGQSIADFANKLADQVSGVFKAYPDARQCNDNVTTNRNKAVEGANKAIKSVPSYGFPEYCLGLLDQMKDSVGPTTLQHFKNATVGDPMSLKAWSQIAVIHQKKSDTAGVVADFQQMITIQPTNRALADQAYKIFRSWGRPDAAEAVVAEQMKLDPSSPDWPELKGNSCAAAAVMETDPVKAKPKFACAYAAFEQVYSLDPSRADSNFYPRMVYVAGNKADSALWIKRWIDKFSSSSEPYKAQLQIYNEAGQTDSALKIVKLLVALDPADLKPVLSAEIALLAKQRYDDAIALQTYFKSADETQKSQFAGILVTYADSASRKTPSDDSVMVKLGQAVIAFNPPNKQYFELGHYFVVRGLQAGFAPLSDAARKDKSCDTVKKYIAYLDLIEPSVVFIAASTNSGIADYGKALNANVQSERKFIPDAQKAFCKP